MSIGKKANLVTDNTVELIIAAAGIVVLIFLLIALYSPTYDENAETAKSYFGMLNEQLSSADSGIEGSVTFWGPESDGVKFYLVYFGSLSKFEEDDDINFVARKRNENAICVCYGNKDKMNCKNCKELDLPVELTLKGYSQPKPWAINPVRQLKVAKTGGNYVFSS